MSKNILIITAVGGFLEKFEYGNVRILQNLGYKVHYASNMQDCCYECDQERMEQNGITVHHVGIARSPYCVRANWKAFWQLVKIVKENDICAIHCHEPMGAVMGRVMGMYFGNERLSVIYTAHGFHFYEGAPLINNTIYYWAERFMARFTDHLVLINREDYKNAKRLNVRNEDNIHLIPGIGLDTGWFSPLEPEDRAVQREKLGLSPEDLFIVSVGELNENKNHMIVVKALYNLRRQGKDISHIKYGICGDGFFRDRMPGWIKELHLEENVFLYGYCNDVRQVLGCADISAFPSIREGLGQAGLEALSMGIPLLAAENRGTREYLQDGVNGFFCGAKDVHSWEKAIEKFLYMPEEEYNSMKAMCRESVMRFAKENTGIIMEEVYRQLD